MTPIEDQPAQQGRARGALFVVATPIGNLEDITFRAVRILKEADVIACEDTRRTQGLLQHYGIPSRTLSYHEHNELTRAPEIILLMEQGSRVALVSDAGTPVISDPGYRLVKLALRHGFPVIPIPGPSAIIVSLVASGLPVDHFRFLGFLPPRKLARQKKLREVESAAETLVLFEAPHRIAETLEDAIKILGDRQVAIGRELTKLHEEFIRGRASEVLASVRGSGAKGELTVLIGPPEPGAHARPADFKLRGQIEALIRDQSLTEREALKALARSTGIPRSEIYRRWQAEKNG